MTSSNTLGFNDITPSSYTGLNYRNTSHSILKSFRYFDLFPSRSSSMLFRVSWINEVIYLDYIFDFGLLTYLFMLYALYTLIVHPIQWGRVSPSSFQTIGSPACPKESLWFFMTSLITFNSYVAQPLERFQAFREQCHLLEVVVRRLNNLMLL